MKFIITVLFLFITFLSNAQETNDKFLEGFNEIHLGAEYTSIKKHLSKQPIQNQHYLKQVEEYNAILDTITINWMKEDILSEIEWMKEGLALVYGVKAKGKYANFLDVPIQEIEVFFDDDHKVRKILLVIEETEENQDKIALNAFDKLGETFCSSGVDGPPELYCIWSGTTNELKIYDWDAWGETSISGSIWVEWRKGR